MYILLSLHLQMVEVKGTQEFVLQNVEARKKFLYENGSEFCMQCDAIKKNYEKGIRKDPFSY